MPFQTSLPQYQPPIVKRDFIFCLINLNRMLLLYKAHLVMEKVDKLITEIQTKVTRLKNDISSTQTENVSLQEKVENLTKKLEIKETEIADLKQKTDGFMQQLASQQPNEVANNDAYIDALVREIDDCINRLKQ